MKIEKEEQKTTQDYILNFYATVQNLIAWFTEYQELLLEVKTFKEHNEEETLDEEQQSRITTANRTLRKSINQVQIHYETFNHSQTKEEREKDQVRTHYEQLSKNYVLEQEKLKEYIIQINKYTMDRIMPVISQNTDMKKIYQ